MSVLCTAPLLKMHQVCSNCLRDFVRVESVDWKLLCHKTLKKYFNVTERKDIALCSECMRYCLSDDKRESKASSWPAMLCKFLFFSREKNDNIIQQNLSEKWMHIPQPWRHWWIERIVLLDDSIDMLTPAASFHVGTEDLGELQDAIHCLEWKSLSAAMDKHLKFPNVRCPFGCSEFLHLCNKLSFEDFLTVKSNSCFESHSKAFRERSWMSGARPDYPSSITLLENDDFVCRPTIVIDDEKGICILGCRHHEQNHKLSYLHPPDSPTGSLYTANSNQCAQVVLRSRTLRQAKLNNYSDTYETVFFQGGFDGVDSAYLSSFGNYNVEDNLADKRSLISIAGREDLKHHVAQLSKNPREKNYLPSLYVNKLLTRSEKKHPCVKRQYASHLQSATYIDLTDAVSLQQEIYNETGYVLRAHDDPAAQEAKDVHFLPKWPFKIIRIHPCTQHGAQFEAINETVGSFVAWTLLGSISCVSELWVSLAKTVRSNASWEGWALSLTWEAIRNSSIRNNHFNTKPKTCKKENNEEMRKRLAIVDRWKNTNIKQHKNWWHSIDGVQVQIGKFDDRFISETTETVVVVGKKLKTFMPSEEVRGWELRFVCFRNRHRTRQFLERRTARKTRR